jgi:alkaline phosphatase
MAAATLLVAGALVAMPVAASAAIGDHGGAARNSGDMTQALRDSIVNSGADNVILLIGDGMGDSEITVARNYEHGADGAFPGIDALPITGQYTTYAVNGDGTPDYTSESASTASAWSTGTKAVNGSLSVDYRGEAQATLLELAKANGKKTGNVSTAEIQDATPAAQYSHVNARGCYGPTQTTANCSTYALERGGIGSISEQLLDVRPDLTLGGGAATFVQQRATAGQWQGETLQAQAIDRGFQWIDDAAGLNALTIADQSAPVLGLFTDGNFPTRYTSTTATIGGGDQPATACTPNADRLDPALSLGSLTSKAIDLLSTDEDGFFLQVEGASIDKRDHAADACGQIGETADLDEAVQAALEFARADGSTLVVVTADHAHTSQIVGAAGPGLSSSLLTEEGQKMIVAYGTSPEGGSQQHTGAQVRIGAYGPGAANVAGLTDQTDVFFTATGTLDLNPDRTALNRGASITFDGEATPGASITATVTGLPADWQATGALDEGEASAEIDVIDGSATFPVTVPADAGTSEFTVTGAQTGTSVTAELTVTEDGAVVTPPDGEDAGGENTGGDAAGAVPVGFGGGMAITGADALPLALIAAGLLLAGVAVVLARRRLTERRSA